MVEGGGALEVEEAGEGEGEVEVEADAEGKEGKEGRGGVAGPEGESELSIKNKKEMDVKKLLGDKWGWEE